VKFADPTQHVCLFVRLSLSVFVRLAHAGNDASYRITIHEVFIDGHLHESRFCQGKVPSIEIHW